MRYFSFVEYDPGDLFADATGGYIVTLSEQEILNLQWDHWYTSMCKRFGKKYVDQNFNIEDCINDFVVVHWAQEVKDQDRNLK